MSDTELLPKPKLEPVRRCPIASDQRVKDPKPTLKHLTPAEVAPFT
jgi:hypothetical protein